MNNNIKKNLKMQMNNKIENNEIIGKCTDKKKKNLKFSNYISDFLSNTGNERISTCGDFIALLSDLHLENKKLYKANFCGNRFCPMCSWRTAIKDSFEINVLMNYLREKENKEFIFLTLTTPNVKAEELGQAIKDYNKGFERLMKRKEVKSVVKGYIRKLEVTYQKEKYINKELWNKKKNYYINLGLQIGDKEPNYNSYNPHFHVLIVVNKSYFKKNELYINQQKWLDLWKKSIKDNRVTQVDVRKVKLNDNKAIYEIAKYSAKDNDYLVNKNVFKVFYNALKGKQLLVFSGMFKDAHKMYSNNELDIYKEKDEIEYFYILKYNWFNKQYNQQQIRELSEDEKKEINNKYIDYIST